MYHRIRPSRRSYHLTMLACVAWTCMAWVWSPSACAAEPSAPAPSTTTKPLTKQGVLEDWQRRRFGIFLHWSACSILELGGGSWERSNSAGFPQQNQTSATPPAIITSGDYKKYKGAGSVPQEVYDNLFHIFNPTAFDARAWAKLFKKAGAGYVVFTAKHHDGFCMYDTKTQDYDIMHTPFRRDICKELAEACRAEGLMFLFYYSPPDWWNTGWTGARKDGPYLDSHFLPQVEELLTGYGPIQGLWWDGSQIDQKYSQKIVALINKHQPWLIVNGRLGDGVSSEFNTPEQTLGEFNMQERWESCITMTGDAWFWNGGRDYKSATTCLRLLIQCADGDGNLLLDTGPRPDGRIDDKAVATYHTMGRWLDTYGATIRGTRGGPFKPGPWGGSTRVGNKIYLHITQLIDDGQLVLPNLPAKITRARCLTGGDISFKQTDQNLRLTMSTQAPIATIVELTIDQDALAITPIDAVPAKRLSLADNADGTSSSDQGKSASCVVRHAWEKGGATLHFGEPGFEEQQAALAKKPANNGEGYQWYNNGIGHPYRYWQADSKDATPWIELAFASEKTFSEICLQEHYGYTESFACDALVKGTWTTLFTAQEMGLYNRKLKQPVTATKFRIRFLKFNGQVSLSSVMLY